MTICKIFERLPEKGKSYKRADLLVNIGPGEYMCANYFDPNRGVFFSFFNEDNDRCENVFEKGTFRYRRRDDGIMGAMEPWEFGKVRYMFFHRTGKPSGEHEYLGETIDEEQVTIDGHAWKQYTLR